MVVMPWVRLFSIGATLFGPIFCIGAMIIAKRRLEPGSSALRKTMIGLTVLLAAQVSEHLLPWGFLTRANAGILPYVLRPAMMCASYVAYAFLLSAIWEGRSRGHEPEQSITASHEGNENDPYQPPRG